MPLHVFHASAKFEVRTAFYSEVIAHLLSENCTDAWNRLCELKTAPSVEVSRQIWAFKVFSRGGHKTDRNRDRQTDRQMVAVHNATSYGDDCIMTDEHRHKHRPTFKVNNATM